MIRLRIAWFLCFLAGCQINVPQFDSAKALAGQLTDNSKDISGPTTQRWTARLGDQGRLMTLYRQDGFWVFVSEEGDAVAFDGWQIRSLIGFKIGKKQLLGPEYNISIRQEGARRETATCDPWLRTLDNAGTTLWTQFCEGVGTNSIGIGANGDLISITHLTSTRGDFIELHKR